MSNIAELNDKLRKNIFNPGKNKVVITSGVATLSLIDRMNLLKKIIDFNDFNKANDTYKEHDFGRIEHKGINYFFKIDYYDNDLIYGSEDASNEDITTRVLTIMCTDEY